VQTRCPLEPSFAYTDRVTVTLRDGTLRDSGPIRFARGHAELPLDEAQLLEKLYACAQPHERALADGIVARITAALDLDAS
jgi:2-methylcitrate dehydratase PrpD